MKKKMFLFVAIFVIIIASCAMLVACDPKANDEPKDNQETITAPSNPVEFYAAWKDSAKMSLSIDDDMKIEISENAINMAGSQYFEITDTQVVSYTRAFTQDGDSWRKRVKTIEEAKEENEVEGKLKPIHLMGEMLDTFDPLFKEFDKFFTKTDNGYVGNADTEVEGCKLTVDGLTMSIVNTDEDDEYSYVFKIGGDTVVIPDEVKNNAEEYVPNPTNPAEFFDRFKNSKKMRFWQDGSLELEFSENKLRMGDNQYFEITETHLITYIKTDGNDGTYKWSKRTWTIEEAKESHNVEGDLKPYDLVKLYFQAYEDIFKDYENLFTKEGVSFIGKQGTIAESIEATLYGLEMSVRDYKFNGEDIVADFIFGIGGTDVVIPEEALNAEEAEY